MAEVWTFVELPTQMCKLCLILSFTWLSLSAPLHHTFLKGRNQIQIWLSSSSWKIIVKQTYGYILDLKQRAGLFLIFLCFHQAHLSLPPQAAGGTGQVLKSTCSDDGVFKVPGYHEQMTILDGMEGLWWVLCQVRIDSLSFLSAKVNTVGKWFPGAGGLWGLLPWWVVTCFYERGLIN